MWGTTPYIQHNMQIHNTLLLYRKITYSTFTITSGLSQLLDMLYSALAHHIEINIQQPAA